MTAPLGNVSGEHFQGPVRLVVLRNPVAHAVAQQAIREGKLSYMRTLEAIVVALD